MKHLIAALMIFAMPFAAQARDAGAAPVPQVGASTCEIYGEVSGIGVSIGLGGQVIGGSGEISCYDEDGYVLSRVPVQLTFLSGGWGFDFSVIRSMVVRSSAVRVSNGPADLIGSFSVGATAGATLINRGIDFDAAVELTGNTVGLELALQGRDVIGLGARLHAMTFIVAPK